MTDAARYGNRVRRPTSEVRILKREYRQVAKEIIYEHYPSRQTAENEIGISSGSLSRFLGGQAVSSNTFNKICDALGLDTNAVSEEASSFLSKNTLEIKSVVEDLKESSPDNIQQIAASQIELLHAYYSTVLAQSQRSFKWALVAALTGFAFFVIAVSTLIIKNPRSNLAWISLLSGAVIEVISGLNFYLYGKTTSQLAQFQDRLDITQRYLLANSLCEQLEGEHKHLARVELIRSVAKIQASSSKAE